MVVRVQSAPFDPGDVVNSFATDRTGVGAIVTFTGIVRDLPDNSLQKMRIEHYPKMTEKAIMAMVDTATQRWSLRDCLVIHRYGDLEPGETIMMVATAAVHRADAFAAAEYLMDYLKSRAPFWKKEITEQGANWVMAEDDDEVALERW